MINMLKYNFILTLLLTSISLQAFEVFDFNPIMIVKDSIVIERIARDSNGDIIVAGVEVLESNPIDYTSNLKIYKSTDEGISWDLLFTQNNEDYKKENRVISYAREILCTEKGDILVFSNNGYVFRSNDFGYNWTIDSLGTILSFKMSVVDNDKISALWHYTKDIGINQYENHSKVFLYDGNNSSWHNVLLPSEDLIGKRVIPDKIYLKSNNVILLEDKYESVDDSLIYISSYLLSSSDLGKNWDKEDILLPVGAYFFDILNENHLISWGVLYNGTKFDNSGNPFGDYIIYESYDRGLNWDTLYYELDTNTNNRNVPVTVDYLDNRYLIAKQFNTFGGFFDKEKDKLFYIIPNNIKGLREAFGYKNKYDFIYSSNKILIAGGSNYLFEVDLSNPITSVEYGNLVSNLLIYPNPLPKNKELNIQLTPNSTGKAEIRIIGIDGREHYQFDELFKDSSKAITLNKNLNLQSGIYILDIEYSNGKNESRTFVVE